MEGIGSAVDPAIICICIVAKLPFIDIRKFDGIKSRCLVKLGCIFGIGIGGGYRRIPIIVKGIGVLCGGCFGRGGAGVIRCFIRADHISLQHFPVSVDPCDHVPGFRSGEGIFDDHLRFVVGDHSGSRFAVHGRCGCICKDKIFISFSLDRYGIGCAVFCIAISISFRTPAETEQINAICRNGSVCPQRFAADRCADPFYIHRGDLHRINGHGRRAGHRFLACDSYLIEYLKRTVADICDFRIVSQVKGHSIGAVFDRIVCRVLTGH